jgi:hypothetical protein
MVGADDWGYYGWDDGFDAQGNWKRGPLHGYVYILPNVGTTKMPSYGQPMRLQTEGEDINVYGNPMPNMNDFDGDGDLDLLCGEFLDGFTYFENRGTRADPEFAPGRRLARDGERIHMHVQMITPNAVDWDGDGDIDLVCGDEDGRVALIENLGGLEREGMPRFADPVYFQQEAADLKFGALVTPVSVDWDSDGDEDLICGNTSGNIGWIENLDAGNPPRWSAPKLLQADGKTIHVQAGPTGSIQGPAEAKWGYTTLSVADWNHDGLLDLIINSITGRIEWYENIGSKGAPKLAANRPLQVAYQGASPKPAWTWWEPGLGELVTQWRTTPLVVDWNEDGLNDLLVLDQQGYLVYFERAQRVGDLVLLPARRIFRGGHFDGKHKPAKSTDEWLRLNTGSNGASGRRKMCVVDWDGDGRRDIMINSVNANWLRNVSDDGTNWMFEDEGTVGERVLAGHTTSPTTVDWDRDGIRDLLLGAEDGRFYFMRNPNNR